MYKTLGKMLKMENFVKNASDAGTLAYCEVRRFFNAEKNSESKQRTGILNKNVHKRGNTID